MSLNFIRQYFNHFYTYVFRWFEWAKYLFGWKQSSETIQTNKTKISDVLDVTETIRKKQVNPENEIIKNLFPTLDFSQKHTFLNSDEIIEMMNTNISNLTAAKDMTDKIFYFTRMANFPIYGIKDVMKTQLEEIMNENKDELLLAILNKLDWDFAKTYYIRKFYSCNVVYYKLMFGRPLLQKIGIYEEYEVEHNGEKTKRVVYDDVKLFFLYIGKDETQSVNVRADCLDAIISYSGELKKEASDVINKMGQLYIDNKEQTIFTNSQNAHANSIQLSCVASFKNLLDYHVPDGNVDEIYQMILLKLNDYPDKKEKVINSLKRIIIDPSRLFGFTLSEILSVVWKEMERQKKYKSELETRLIEELFESDDTCTSGFFTRAINILSGFTPAVRIKISDEDQTIAKIVSRIKKEMNNLTVYEKERLSLDIVSSDDEESPDSLRITLRDRLKNEITDDEDFKELKNTLKERFDEILNERLESYFGK